jgi:phage terminase large subunit
MITLTHQYPTWAKDFHYPSRYKGAWGGRGSTKSWTAARILVEIAARFPIRWLCTREIQKSIKESVHKLLCDMIEELGYSDVFQITDRVIRGASGSEFIFEGLWLNVNNIKSLEGLDGAWVEEAEKVSANSWKVLIPTIRRESRALADWYRAIGHRGIGETVGSEIWVTFNPDEEEDPTSQMFIIKPVPDAIIRKVNYTENPWFKGSVLEKEMLYMKKVDPDTHAHVWLGEFRRNKAAQIFAGKYELRDFKPEKNWTALPYGLDFGFASDPLSFHKYWSGPDGPDQNTLYVEKEAWGHGVELNDIAPLIRRECPEIGKRLIIADNSRPETISHLVGLGLNVIGCEKWPGCVEDGVAYLRSLAKIVIHKTNCPHAAENARYYSYKVDKVTGLVLNKIVDAHNHFWDDCRYALQGAIMTPESSVIVDYQEEVMQTGIQPELADFDRADIAIGRF